MILTSSQRLIAVLALCLAGFGLTVTFYYPGFMSYDSVEQLFDARRGIYGDAHPPFMAFIWGSIDKLIPGSFGILLFQSLLIWIGAALIALGWFDAPDRSAGWLAVPALLVLYPPIFGIAGAIWKDLSMLGFFMIAIGCAGTIKPAEARWLPFVVAASALSCAVLLRHNAIFAAMPLIILCLYRLRTKGAFRIPISIAGGVLASILLLLATTSFNASLAKVHREPWAWIAIFNIAGVLQHMHDRPQQQAIYDAVPEQLRANGLDAVLASYRPRYVLTLFDSDRPAFACPTGGNGGPPGHHLSKFETCFEMSDVDARQLRNVWFETIARHPWPWLKHRTAVFREVIGATSDPLWDPYYFAQVRGVTVPKDALTAVYGGEIPSMSRVQAAAAWRLERLAGTVVYRPWLYLMIAVAVITWCLWRRGELTLQIALIAASGLTHEAGLFLLAPSADFRYSHYMIFAALLSGALLLRTSFGARASAKGVGGIPQPFGEAP